MIRWIKKQYKKLKGVPARTFEFYNNLLSGIIGGAIILFISILKDIRYILDFLWYLVLLWCIGFLSIFYILKGSKLSKKKHLWNYIWNTLAALIGGFYLIGMYHWNKFLSTIFLIVSLLIIVFVRNKCPYN